MRIPALALLSLALPAAAAIGQTSVFPPDYGSIPDGPNYSPNLPLAYGTSRVQFVYDAASLTVPVGHQISKISFREDGSITTMITGRSLQLEVRMGYSTFSSANLSSTFDSNFANTPVTVFGPALFVLPNLHDVGAPLTNGQFGINITPFTYSPPAGQNLLIEYRIFGTSLGGAVFNYYIDRADYVSPVVNGPAGCPHSSGTAVLTVDPTRPGLYYNATMTTGPAASPGVLAINIGSPLAPAFPLTGVFAGISPLCTGQVSPVGLATLGGVSGGSGYGNWSFYIPNNVMFSGLAISSQCLFLDFFSPGGLVVSNGAQVTTGTNPRASACFVNGPPTTSLTGSLAYNYCPVTFFTHN
ncbi:MAG TPA: hypothetical protein VFZ65_08155 [Planctomycetota bacterium]|nr:hypothetical protein [Planctomycetota bacterium]